MLRYIPSRSSRSRPASFTCCSVSTGSASRTAIWARSPSWATIGLTLPAPPAGRPVALGCPADSGCPQRRAAAGDRMRRSARAHAVPVTRILLRPFRLETWRELAFVLLGGLMAIVGFCVQRSRRMASAAPRSAPAAGSPGSATASRRWTGRWSSRAPRAVRRSFVRRSHARRDRRRPRAASRGDCPPARRRRPRGRGRRGQRIGTSSARS